jgi:hypothetical protein
MRNTRALLDASNKVGRKLNAEKIVGLYDHVIRMQDKITAHKSKVVSVLNEVPRHEDIHY